MRKVKVVHISMKTNLWSKSKINSWSYGWWWWWWWWWQICSATPRRCRRVLPSSSITEYLLILRTVFHDKGLSSHALMYCMFFYPSTSRLSHRLIRRFCIVLKKKTPLGCVFLSVAGRFSGWFGFRNAAVNLFGELKPDSCVNRVKTSRHHLVHKSWERLREAGRLGASSEHRSH